MKKARHLTGERWPVYFAEPLPPEASGVHEAVQVWVSKLEPESEKHGLNQERLQTEVEVRLTQSGISLEESRAIPGGPRFPCLGVIIHLDRVEGPLASYVFSLEVFFVQSTYRGGLHPAGSLKMTWCKEAIGDARETGQGLDWGNLYDDLGLLVDEFVQDYLTVSPHSRTARIIN